MRALCLVACLLLGAGVARAQKQDSVWLRNGDHVTGEVKSLARALLKYSTNDLGTINIEWDKIVRLNTRTVLEVQLRSGRRYVGRLGVGPNGRVVIQGDTVPLADIVVMVQIGKTVLRRIDGYVDIGFSFQKAHSTTQLTTGSRVLYRLPGSESALQIDSFLEDRDDAAQTSRASATLAHRILLPKRYSVGALLGYDENEELDLAARLRASFFATRAVYQTQRAELRATGGIARIREHYYSTDSTTGSFEAIAGVAYRAFRYDSPKLDVALNGESFISLSIAGRVRGRGDARVSYEVMRDFTVAVTLFDAFDSKPQAAGATRNDFGSTLSIGWTF